MLIPYPKYLLQLNLNCKHEIHISSYPGKKSYIEKNRMGKIICLAVK